MIPGANPAAISGSIPPEGVTAILRAFDRSRSTGLLEVYGPSRVLKLALRRGVPIHACPGERPWRLGEVLHHLGRSTNHPDFRRTIVGGTEASRSGERLVRRGLASHADVASALKEQIRLRAQELIRLDRGRFRFFAGGSSLHGLPRQPDRWSVTELIAAIERSAGCHEGLRRLVDRLEQTEDPLEALGLPPGTDADRVRAAFRALAKDHHPDHLLHVTDPFARRLHARAFHAALAAYRRAQSTAR